MTTKPEAVNAVATPLIPVTPKPAALNAAVLTPAAAWSRRVRRIGGFIQAAFAAFWLRPMSMPQADNSVAGFRSFFNPATGEWITYTALAEDSDGQLVRFTWRSVPGGVITEHVHPRQEERFTILAGEAHFTLNGAELVAGAGDTIVVPAGVPHSEGNPGPGEIDGVVELRPALRTKEWHEALAGLVADGKTTLRGAPRNPLQLGATFWYFRHESRVTSPPIWAQNLMLPPLWALAKVFGVRPYYDHWDSRIRGTG